MEKKLLGYYDYTVLLTYTSLIMAVQGIFRVIHDDFRVAIILLMLSGLCDMFDGTVAATKKRTVSEKNFGIQIDSLCDLVAFGVLPGIFTYKIRGMNRLSGVISVFYVLFALIRLAYFNVMEEERQKETEETRKVYLGVPVTTVALILPAVYMIYDYGLVNHADVFPILLMILGVGFLTPVEIKKPQKLGKLVILFIGAFELVGVLHIIRCGLL